MKTLQLQDRILKLAGTILAIVAIAVLLSLKFFRIDFTNEKRYTLADVTKETLGELDDIVYVKVYLEGDLNTQLKRLQISIRETLDEFRVYGKDNLHYEFINPSEAETEKIRNAKYKELYEQGLMPINIKDTDEEGGESEKIVFPGAIVYYKNAHVAVNLLKNNQSLTAEENLNNSKQALEYELINMIINITSEKIDKVAFIEGHGELNEYETSSITREMASFFQVDRGKINGQYGILDGYKAVIIAKPTVPFSEEDKFVLDQYVMNGGKVLWFIDNLKMDIDSLSNGSTVALINDLNLDDMLFRYGVRVNPVLLKDLNCNYIPINTALEGNKPKFTPTPWPYYPLLQGNRNHPISSKLNLVSTRFSGTIDMVGDSTQLSKTVLLASSQNSYDQHTPAFISLDELREKPKTALYNKINLPVAVFLKGQFQSVFKNRFLTHLLPASATFKESVDDNSMLVVADGDIIQNDVRYSAQGPTPLPLGYDEYTRQTFGNKTFVLNALNFMTGNEALITLRSREFKLRLLDKSTFNEDKSAWQIVNIVVPIVLILLFGLSFAYDRKRKYAKKAEN